MSSIIRFMQQGASQLLQGQAWSSGSCLVYYAGTTSRSLFAKSASIMIGIFAVWRTQVGSTAGHVVPRVAAADSHQLLAATGC
jgi:hypothetical protein